MALYRDKERRQIDKKRWLELRKKPNYPLIKRFEYNQFAISLIWHGEDFSDEMFVEPEIYRITCEYKQSPTHDWADYVLPSDLIAAAATLDDADRLYEILVVDYCDPPMSFDDLIDQSVNEYEESAESRLDRFEQDPTAPSIEHYGSGKYA